jgi:sigma-B regulation protein RsbU (phosphoserine phosphatase)
MKILVADNDAVHRCVLASMIRKLGHEVVEAPDGESAWRKLTREPFSVVISDWMMPIVSGLELTRRIRAANFSHYVYTILCTSGATSTDVVGALDAGADDFLTKPVSIDELRGRIHAGERILKLEQRLADKNRDLEVASSKLRTAFERIESDLRAAAWVQENLLPSPQLNALGVTCNWRYRPASYMAGDIFNFFAIDERHVGFYLLDVSGHGVPAAMLSVALSIMLSPDGGHGSPLKRYNPFGQTFEVAKPVEVMTELNKRFQSMPDKHFTMSYGLLDAETSLLRLAQAGNPNPLMIQSSGHVKALTSGGMPVGLWPSMDLDYIEVPFERGDRLMLYSDGITECTNARNEEFGDDRLVKYLRDSAAQPLHTLLNGLEGELETWHGSTRFTDDISLLAVELAGQKEQYA